MKNALVTIDSIKLLISSILIFISFFIGYAYGIEKNNAKLESLENKKYYVNLDISKTKIDIKSPENIIVKINGEETQSGSIDIMVDR